MSTSAATSPADSPRPRAATSPAAVVHGSGLPSALGALVLAVTGNCRLWNSERTEVARELCAHFRDGLDAGATPGELSASFGDPRHAAKLITITRRKLRPLWWRTSRASLRALGAFLLLCIVLYAILAARYMLFSPSIKRNIMNELNAPVLQTPLADRAWPLYVEAKIQFGELPEDMLSGSRDPRRPGDDGWDEMVVWLDAHKPAIQTVRRAAALPVLGYVYRPTLDPDLIRALEITIPGYKHDLSAAHVPDNPLIVGLLLPHLGEMRRFARHLQADAHLAASRNDAETFVADIHAMLGISSQLLQEPTLISTLVGIAVTDLAVSITAIEAARPDFLSREQLRDLAHSISAHAGGHVRIDASFELYTIEDVLQRFFSDNGKGDGHFVGGPTIDEMYDDFGVARPRAMPIMKAVRPVQSVLISSRAEITELAHRFVAAAAVDDSLPPWRHDERSSDTHYAALMNSGIYSAVPFLESLHAGWEKGPIKPACAARDTMETRRDVALIVLAIESFRRTQGQWPDSLAQLVPAYLPSIPLDPFTGKSLRYRPSASASERPLLYSVGVDGVDDGGAIPSNKTSRSEVRDFRWLGQESASHPLNGASQREFAHSRGDWILWPELPPIPESTIAPSPPTTEH
jgi:hypothetical protein